MNIENKELIVQANETPAQMISSAVKSGANLEQLERLLALQERFEANEARKAYHKAMSDFKANPPQIFKDKHVAFGQTKYNHASLGNVVEKITARLSEFGLSHSWRVKQNGVIEVFCRITHVMGHSEETSISAGADKSGAKNDIQSIGSAITYLQRYSLLAMTGLATEEQDNDGRASQVVELIDEKEIAILEEYFEALQVNRAEFLKYMQIGSLEEITKQSYPKAINALKTRAQKKGNK